MLTPKQLRFVDEYLIDFNGSAAYRRAGYRAKNERVSRTAAAKLIANASVAAAIAARQQARQAQSGLTAARVIAELQRLAFSDPRAIYRPDGSLKAPREWDDDTAASIAGVETDEKVGPDGKVTVTTKKVKRWDKNVALLNAMKHLGLLKEDAPHPDRARPDLSRLTDDVKHTLLAGLRIALGRVPAGLPVGPPG